MSSAAPDAVRCAGIAKSYGAIRALRDVSMHVGKGEVLGLVGDNGAGKSTLIKILTGYLRPDAGELWVEGRRVELRSVGDARRHGIETVYQDLALIPELPVYHNLFLNRERLLPGIPLLHNRRMRRESAELLESMGVAIPDIDAPVAQLSGGQRQAIAIARAIHSNPRVLLLDEPLAAMGAKEGALILDLVHRLKQRGDVSIIVIAHNYAHVFDIGDRVNVLQHGEITFDRRTADTSLEELTELMVDEYRRARAG